MKQLTIHIPESKFQFIMELLSDFKYIRIDTSSQGFVLTEEQKRLANEEFKKMEENPDYALDWDNVKQQLDLD